MFFIYVYLAIDPCSNANSKINLQLTTKHKKQKIKYIQNKSKRKTEKKKCNKNDAHKIEG